MTKQQFIDLHLHLHIHLPKTIEVIPIDSATDPTQDIPIRAIQFAANGVPLNVKEYKKVFSNIKVEQFTSIEKRNCDKFDNYGELQKEISKVTHKGVTTNFIKSKK